MTTNINTFCSDIISYNSKYGVRTRSQTIKSTSSCRMWQLILAISDNLNTRGLHLKYYQIISMISEIIERVKLNPILNSLIYLNNTSGVVKKYEVDRTHFKLGNNYMCIYIEGLEYSILHYFTIIYTKNGDYYLNSSYASEYVCVPQYTSLITIEQLNRFVGALYTDEEYVSEFFHKYFLKGNIFKPSLKVKEIEFITRNIYRDNICCGIIPDYDALIKSVL